MAIEQAEGGQGETNTDSEVPSENHDRANVVGSRAERMKRQLSTLPIWARNSLIGTGCATLILLTSTIVGFSISAHNYQVATDRLNSLLSYSEDLAAAESELDDAEDEVVRLESNISAVEGRERVVAAKQAELDELEANLLAREVAVGAKEKQVEESSFGDGVRVVGTTVKPGVYTTEGPDGSNSVGCYYAWMSGTGSDADIVDNNIVGGAATVTLREGDIFESSSCQDWVKVG